MDNTTEQDRPERDKGSSNSGGCALLQQLGVPMGVYKVHHCKQGEEQLQSLIKKAPGMSQSKDRVTALLGKGQGNKAGWEASSEDVFPSKPRNQLSDDAVFMFSS